MSRLYFMDSARAFCMLLGIPYHAALVYSFGPWRIKADQSDLMLDFFARATTIFRMPTFFVIAGFFATLIACREGPRRWLAKRCVRLLVPLVFGLATICPITLLLSGMVNPAREASLLSNSQFYVAHLWFLATLFWLCVTYAAIFPFIASLRIMTRAQAMIGVSLFAAWGMIEDVRLPSPHGLIDVEKFLQYLPFFLLGALLGQDSSLRERLLRMQAMPFVLAVACLAGFFATDMSVLKMLATLFASQSVLILLFRFGNIDSRAIRSLVDTSFTIYLVHLPIILLFAYWFLDIDWHPWIEFAFISCGTLALSYVIALGVERSSTLKLLFNGVLPARRPQKV